jgi:hypothetical protein
MSILSSLFAVPFFCIRAQMSIFQVFLLAAQVWTRFYSVACYIKYCSHRTIDRLIYRC